MDDYDRWYRSYRRRQRIVAGIGWFLAGLGAALIVWLVIVLFTVTFGGTGR